MQLQINKRFRDLIPPLSPVEREQLEANIIADGCRDPLATWNGIIVDGHNRYEICQKHKLRFNTVGMDFADEDVAAFWIIMNQFGRRNLTAFARGELALKAEAIISKQAKANQVARKGKQAGATLENSPKLVDTRCELAKLAGVSDNTIAKVKLIRDNADEETKAKLRTKSDVSIHKVAKEIKDTKAKQAREVKRQDAAKDAPREDKRVVVGDFRDHADEIPDGSLSLIFTDPPYDREASKLLPDLAEFAAAKLADGGSLVCYVGHTQLLSALDAFRQHLRYWWVIACIHSGGASVMREYGVNAKWKPVLWFVKGTRNDASVMVNDTMSGGEEKEHHDWQQAESEAAYWIEKLTPPDGLVCDPFLGSGTTAKAAESLGRPWIGFEVNKDTAAIARKRVVA